MNTKTIVAGLAGSAAVATAALAYNQPTLEGELLTQSDYQFMNFVSEHGRSYATKAEFQFRSKIFKETVAELEEINAKGEHTVGVNFMADWTKDERKRLNGYRAEQKRTNATEILSENNLAAEVNWVTKGAVTPVKNQGQCGSCWSFSTTGAVEGAMFLSTGKLQSFSEQQLVDCSKSGNMGCNGGLMDTAFKYIESNPLELESDYAYTARDGTCSYVKSKGVGQVKSYKDVQSGSVSQMKAALNQQPVAIALEADQSAFQFYTSGVLRTGCGQQLDHGVLAAGYGTEDGVEYVLVKNSWGASWGDKGYLKIELSDKNVCGFLSQPSYPTE